MAEDREGRIRERAYALWENDGRPHGRHEEHWHQADREVADELFRQQGGTDGGERRGALDGGLLPEGGLVASGGPAGTAIGGLGVAGEPTSDDKERMRRSS